MSRTTRYSRCWTLRLTPTQDDSLESLAYDLRLSKAGTIRHILGSAIALAYGRKASTDLNRDEGGEI